jgi:DNA ligase-associated metallophosphoesterase
MPGVLDLFLAGEPMQALAGRALYWPARRRLLIADLHLGKGDILRAAGIAVPSGGTRSDLSRLDGLLQRTGARELWILGDFLHGTRHPVVERAWLDLRAAHPALAVAVVAGNHDRALQPDALGVELLPGDVPDGPFRFRHHPLDAPDAGGGHVMCGHVHPVVTLPGLPGRYPALLLEPRQTVLPAFSAFTGGCRVDQPGRHWVACARGELVAHLP